MVYPNIWPMCRYIIGVEGENLITYKDAQGTYTVTLF